MTEPRIFPFGGVPVYNPQSLSRTEAIAQFHVRQAPYSSLIGVLREELPSHVLLIGARGMGKTTLLQRVHYGVEDDPVLNSRYVVLVFPEEQYNVNRLHHFLLNTVDALADAMERDNDARMLARVEEFGAMIGTCTPEQIEDRVPQFLAEITGKMRRIILLLVDNADRLFETIESAQQWRFRELLSTRRDLTFFGATTQASEGIYGPDRAFFEFFKLYQLAPLTLPEVKDLLLRLSESVEEKEGEKGAAKQRVADWLDADPGRLQTLVQLTGGNPRTTVLLFHLVLDGLAGGAREYLEQLLDQVTPTYKGRMDELPSQAQQVLDAVALRWDPATAMDVHDYTGLETSAVSTQLTRLVRQGILEKADPGDSKKATYQVAERFFNIWYLMRASRRVREKLRWFVEFLRVFYDSNELDRIARERVDLHQGAWRERPEEIETLFAYVLASGTSRSLFENYLRQRCSDSDIQEMRPHLDLMADENGTGGGPTASRSGRVDAEAEIRRALENEPENAEHWSNLGHLLGEQDRAAEAGAAYRKAIDLHASSGSWSNLGVLYAKTPGRTRDAEVAFRKALELDPKASAVWGRLSTLLMNRPERAEDAEMASQKAIEFAPNVAVYWGLLGASLILRPERAAEAEMASRKAIGLDPNAPALWRILGAILATKPERADEAESAIRTAIELDPMDAFSWCELGGVLAANSERAQETEQACRRAAELSPANSEVWRALGAVLLRTGRVQQAESAYRTATLLDPRDATSWVMLGHVLAFGAGRYEDAEFAVRRAIELDPNSATHWTFLGALVGQKPERDGEAEMAFRKAIELDAKNPTLWVNLGVLLSNERGRSNDAKTAFRNAVELDPRNSVNIRTLGVLLYCELASEEAIGYLRRAHELAPNDHVSAAIYKAALQESETERGQPVIPIDVLDEASFWGGLLGLCENYPPFGKLLLGICDLVQSRGCPSRFVGLFRAVALAQLGDFPRASVALEDALSGDPIEQLSLGMSALETFFAAAARNGRVHDCIELIDKKGWQDAWRPIYEALQAIEAGSTAHLKRIAVEIRDPAQVILGRIAPRIK